MSRQLLVLAAGLGSRYGGDKQSDGLGPNGERIIDYSVTDAIRAGFTEIVFVIRRNLEAFEQDVRARYEGQISVQFAYQELDDLPDGCALPEGREKPWGTAHAIFAARSAMNAPFLVINADDFYGAQSFALAAQELDRLNGTNNIGGLIPFALANTLSEHGTVSRGVCSVTEKNVLNHIEEHHEIQRTDIGAITGAGEESGKRSLEDTCPVSMNLWLLTPEILASLGDDFAAWFAQCENPSQQEYGIPTWITTLMARGVQFSSVVSPERWFGVTYYPDRESVQQQLVALHAQGLYS